MNNFRWANSSDRFNLDLLLLMCITDPAAMAQPEAQTKLCCSNCYLPASGFGCLWGQVTALTSVEVRRDCKIMKFNGCP